ncbi:hypothetical protein AUJ62_00395 [Candidatus Pacearchaeota archaeon CG1_02_32_21]|nr:MAG: hypothetical protein AUJ62_00395 [Candidatus Pacearchaeota archaeon CG1_02_32_21]
MAKVIINGDLEEQINKKFKAKSIDIFEMLYSLKENPYKGKLIGSVGGIVIKELRYENFRFYFITDGYKLKVMDKNILSELLIKFVIMSDKKDQQKIINEIRTILTKFGEKGFDF